MLSWHLTMAKQEEVRINERTRAGLAQARSRGVKLGRPLRIFSISRKPPKCLRKAYPNARPAEASTSRCQLSWTASRWQHDPHRQAETPKAQKRTKRVPVMFARKELETIRLRAQQAGQPVSTWVREQILKATPKAPQRTLADALVVHVIRHW